MAHAYPLGGDGSFTLAVNAADGSGNIAGTSPRVTRDTAAPVFGSVTPADGTVFGTAATSCRMTPGPAFGSSSGGTRAAPEGHRGRHRDPAGRNLPPPAVGRQLAAEGVAVKNGRVTGFAQRRLSFAGGAAAP